MEIEILKQFVNLTGVGIAGLALYALILLLKRKNNKEYKQLNKKVNNEMEHRFQNIENRLRDVENRFEERFRDIENKVENRFGDVESDIACIKSDVGYLKGRLNNKNK